MTTVTQVIMPLSWKLSFDWKEFNEFEEQETIFMNGPVRVLFLLRVLFTVWMESRRLNVFFEV